ncbi:hypothetical protein HN011_006742 [Eciton burchellii]|nr:hypothetical protein HN011_006742 [Eciton burchellii]
MRISILDIGCEWLHGMTLYVTRLYETAYVSDASSIQIIVKCGRTFRGPLAPIPLQALPVRRGGNGRDDEND